jgi:inosose dehydratase
MSGMKARIAAAPISWGVCEVPGWGMQMDPSRVLKEMSELGFDATEFGPEGFLPLESSAKVTLLKEHGMIAVGGFVPVILYRADHDPLPGILKELEGYEAAGAEVLVLAATTGIAGYDVKRPVLSEVEWQIVFNNLDRIREVAAQKSVTAVLHPHVGTMVETEEDVLRVLHGSTIPFCLDTGHMIIGGTDPVAFSQRHSDRIAHTHLKDVKIEWAKKVQTGELTYYDAVTKGLYRPLGQGDLNVRAIVRNLLTAGYGGWFTLEQDNVVEKAPDTGAGPRLNAKVSLDFLQEVLDEFFTEQERVAN